MEDEGYELAVFHSHIRRPSRGRRAPTVRSRAAGAGKPFLIYGLKFEELRAWTITPEDFRRSSPLSLAEAEVAAPFLNPAVPRLGAHQGTGPLEPGRAAITAANA